MVAIRVRVEDLNGEVVKDCRIEVSDNLGNRAESPATATGEFAWNTDGARVHVLADHPAFAPDSIRVTLAPLEWDLPTARLKATDAAIEIVSVLGRLVAAPTYEVKKERCKVEVADPKARPAERAVVDKRNTENLLRLNNEVAGVLAETRTGARDHYLWLKDERSGVDHERADQFVTVDVDKNRRRVLTSAKATGWARFVTKRSRIDTAAQGQFWLLEYGGSPGRARRAGAAGEQPSLIAVYIPDLEAGPAPTERDMLVFLTPNTYKPEFDVRYPFSLDASGADFLQPFIARLGIGYLFGRFHMPHQILHPTRSQRTALHPPHPDA